MKVISNAVAAVNCADPRPGAGRRRPRGGVDLEALVKVMGAGAASSRDARPQGRADARPRLRRRCSSSSTCSRTCVFCLEEARAAGAAFPFAALAGELYSAGVGRGLGEQDFAAVLEVVEGLTGRLTRRRTSLTLVTKTGSFAGRFENSGTLCIVCALSRAGCRRPFDGRVDKQVCAWVVSGSHVPLSLSPDQLPYANRLQGMGCHRARARRGRAARDAPQGRHP